MELPIVKDVLARTYNSTAFPLSILMTEQEKFLPFVLNNHIQVIRYYDEDSDSSYYNFYFNNSYYHWNCFEMQAIRKNYFSDKIHFLENFLEYNLNQGFYVVSYINEFYQHGGKRFNQSYYLHDRLIYGYDKNNYYTMGYTNNQQYSSSKMSKEEYIDSLFDDPFLSDLNDGDIARRIFMIRPKKDFCEKLSMLRIKNYLQDYIFGINNILVPSSDEELKRTYSFGIQAFRELFQEISENNEIDMRFLRLFYEHKILMKKRIELIGKEVNLNSLILTRYTELERRSKLLFMIFIKNKVKNNVENVVAACEEAKQVLYEEELILRELVDYLEGVV